MRTRYTHTTPSHGIVAALDNEIKKEFGSGSSVNAAFYDHNGGKRFDITILPENKEYNEALVKGVFEHLRNKIFTNLPSQTISNLELKDDVDLTSGKSQKYISFTATPRALLAYLHSRNNKSTSAER